MHSQGTYITLLSLSKLTNTTIQLRFKFEDNIYLLTLATLLATCSNPLPQTPHLEIFCPASNAVPASFFMDILSLRHLSTLPAVPCNFTTPDLDMYASNFTVGQDHANILPTYLPSSIHADLTLPKVLDIDVFGFPPYFSAPTLLYMMIRIFYARHHAL